MNTTDAILHLSATFWLVCLCVQGLLLLIYTIRSMQVASKSLFYKFDKAEYYATPEDGFPSRVVITYRDGTYARYLYNSKYEWIDYATGRALDYDREKEANQVRNYTLLHKRAMSPEDLNRKSKI